MARRCDLTGVGVQSGNKVSHSNRKTRRRFLPNIQKVSLISDILRRTIRLNLTVAALRTIDHNDGLDNYLLTTKDAQLTTEARKLKRQIKRVLEANKKAA